MKMGQFVFKDKAELNDLRDFGREWDSPKTLAIVYFTPKLAGSDFFKVLKSQLPNSIFMGCSGAGEIKQSELADQEYIVTLAKFEKSEVRFACVDIAEEKDSEKAGEAFAKQFPLKGLKALYVLSDGLHVNGTALIRGIRRTIGNDVTISGGLAADGTDFQKTHVLVDGVPTAKALTGVGFYGEDIQIFSSASGGWKPFGPSRVITKSGANVVYELDHKPALALYKEFLGEQAKMLPSAALLFPLHLSSGPENTNRNIVRTILSVDEATQSMTFAGDVPEGTSVQLMRAGHAALIEAALEVANINISKMKQVCPVLSLVVSCVGRRLVLGENTEAEIEKVYEQLPAGSIQTGFYSYGEIAPGSSGACDLHNQTMTLTLIHERKRESE